MTTQRTATYESVVTYVFLTFQSVDEVSPCNTFSSVVLSQDTSYLICSFTVKPGQAYPQEYINEFIIQKLNPLLVVDFRLISAFLHV